MESAAVEGADAPEVEEAPDVEVVAPDLPEAVEDTPAPVLDVPAELREILASCQVNSEVISRLNGLISRIEA